VHARVCVRLHMCLFSSLLPPPSYSHFDPATLSLGIHFSLSCSLARLPHSLADTWLTQHYVAITRSHRERERQTHTHTHTHARTDTDTDTHFYMTVFEIQDLVSQFA